MGCSALDVSNPTRVQFDDVENAEGTGYMMNQVRHKFGVAVVATAIETGLLTDEFFLDATADNHSAFASLDRRESVAYEASILSRGTVYGYANWQGTWRDATVATELVRNYALPPVKGVLLGELFATRGFVLLGLAEQICPGFPIQKFDVHELNAVKPLYTGQPVTTDEALTLALAAFDSALVSTGDSTRVLNLARVGKARALLGLGRFVEAGAVASAVDAGFNSTGRGLNDWLSAFFNERMSVSNGEGGTGIAFISAADARMPKLSSLGQTQNGSPAILRYGITPYLMSATPPIVIASDIEARLIQAEAALNAHDGAWLTILNDLRAQRVTPAMPSLDDPGAFDAQVNLLYRERAFWLFGTGHRLGDLRRLIRRYGRSAESVFPTGMNRVNVPYGTATSIPFPGDVEHRFNPAITGCTSR